MSIFIPEQNGLLKSYLFCALVWKEKEYSILYASQGVLPDFGVSILGITECTRAQIWPLRP